MDDFDIDNMDFMPVAPPSFNPIEPVMVEDATPYKTWVCLYPLYLDANLTVAEGRKVSKADAYPDPNPKAMAEALRRLGLPTLVESDRMHPKVYNNLGRLRVQLKQENGSLTSKAVPNRMTMMRKVGRLLQEIQPSMPKPDPAVPPHMAHMLASMSGGPDSDDEEKEDVKERKNPAATPAIEAPPAKAPTSRKGKKGRK